MSRGRPPKPTKVLELSGAFKKDPKRKRERANEPTTKGPLGSFPVGRGLTQEDAYNWITEKAPLGVLKDSDEIFVVLVSVLLCKVMTGKAKAADHQLLSTSLGKLGMNPSDRAKISIPAPKKRNRWADMD
jgi:hypothetical protein